MAKHQDPELTRVWVKHYTVTCVYNAIATWSEKTCGKVLTSFWQHFDAIFAGFSPGWSNRGSCQRQRCLVVKFTIHSRRNFNLKQSQVVTLWLTIWNRSHQKLSKRCQQLVRNFPIYMYAGGNGKVNSGNLRIIFLKLLKQNLRFYWIIMSGKLNLCTL